MKNYNSHIEQFGFCEKCLDNFWDCFGQFNIGLNPEIKICDSCVSEVLRRVVNSIFSEWNSEVIKDCEADINYGELKDGR